MARRFRAWGQNLRHDKPLTTFNSYGQITRERQGKIIAALSYPAVVTQDATPSEERIAELVAAKMERDGFRRF
jgi:hypothetical protein